MKFSLIPPTFLQKLGGIDDFLLDSAQIFVLVAKTKVRRNDAPWGDSLGMMCFFTWTGQ